MQRKKGNDGRQRKLIETDQEIISSETQLWERQPTEPAKAFEMFTIYRDMSERKMHDGRIRKQFKCSNETITYYAYTYKWKERARAWDNFLDRKKQAETIKAVEEMASRHSKQAIAAARALMEPVKEMLERIQSPTKNEFKNMTIKELYRFTLDAIDKLPKIMEFERKARGADVSKSSIDITSNGQTLPPIININVQGSKSPLIEQVDD